MPLSKAALPLAALTLALASFTWPRLMIAPASAESAVPIARAAVDVVNAKGPQTAIFAGGCFWGVEAVFEHVKGVKSVISGYAGGTAESANYGDVTTERTGHAEVVKIIYDPAIVSYGTLLRVYFSVAHDPTQLNRQGSDTGPSYRSAIFPVGPDQARVARAYIAQLTVSRAFARPIVTQIESGRFYVAEGYHQDFMKRNPNHPYIRRWDVPKLAAFRAGYPSLAR